MLFIGVGADVELGEHGPPVLLLAGLLEEIYRPAQLRAKTNAQVVISPWSEHITAAYDPMNGVNAMNNFEIINELENDRPILYCNTHHAMVGVSIDYFNTPSGPNVVAFGVLDPWPYSPAFHYLSQPEMIPAHMGGQMLFAASVDIED